MTTPSAPDTIRIAVAGRPKPQGSKSIGRAGRGGRPIVLEGRTSTQRASIEAWRSLVRDEAWAELVRRRRTTPLQGPLSVEILFVFSRPRSTPAGHRWRTKTPDLDKLARAVLDALKAGGVYGDDNQVAQLTARKVLALPDETEGAVITVTPLDHTDAPASAADRLPATTPPPTTDQRSHHAQRASTRRS